MPLQKNDEIAVFCHHNRGLTARGGENFPVIGIAQPHFFNRCGFYRKALTDPVSQRGG